MFKSQYFSAKYFEADYYGNVSTVEAPDATEMVVTPATDTGYAGATIQLSAVVLDQNGDPMAVTVNWSSGDTNVATVNSSGLVTLVAPGTVSIFATYDDVSDFADITVTAPSSATPKNIQFVRVNKRYVPIITG